jgi:diacylglycerol O-acyltransferase / wax synthase
MERVGATDAALLAAERPTSPMHVVTVLVVEPPAGGGRFHERLRTVVEERLRSAPWATRRLAEVPFGLDRPLWVEAPDCELDAQLHRVGVPAPGSTRELDELLGDLVAHRLDRARPLWEVWVVERLPAGRVAVVVKEHHVQLDPETGAGLVRLLVDDEPDPPAHAAPATPVAPEPDIVPEPLELAARGLLALATAPLRIAAVLPELVREAQAAWSGPTPSSPHAAARTSLDQPPTPHRRVATTRVPLAAVKAVHAALGVDFHDVVLALCAGSLRRYLVAREELPSSPLVARVGLGTTEMGADGLLDAAVAPVLVSLATQITDPIERVLAIHASSTTAPEFPRAASAEALRALSATTPPGLLALAGRAYAVADLGRGRMPAANVMISDAPGATAPRYLAGARVVATHVLPPLTGGIACAFTATSGPEAVDVAVLVSREAVPEPWRLADGVVAALDELVAAVGERGRAPRGKQRAPRASGARTAAKRASGGGATGGAAAR